MTANLCIALNSSVSHSAAVTCAVTRACSSGSPSCLGQAVPYPPKVVRARFGADASLRGAVALALARAGAPSQTGAPA